MSIIEIIDESLNNSKILKIIHKTRNTNLPLEFDEDQNLKTFQKNIKFSQYVDTSSYYVAPIYTLKNIEILQRFLYEIVPQGTKPTKIIDFRYDKKTTLDNHGIKKIDENYSPKKLLFGKIYYIETIGKIVENTSRIILDEDLVKKYDSLKKNKSTIELYRKVAIQVFPSEKLLEEHFLGNYRKVETVNSDVDTILEYDYCINLNDLNNIK